MSHKAGHIIIQSKASGSTEVVQSTEVQLDFPAGMPIEERIAKVRHAMKVIDRLEHEDDED